MLNESLLKISFLILYGVRIIKEINGDYDPAALYLEELKHT